MKNILIQTSNPLDGVSLMRLWGPLAELERKGKVKLTPFSNKIEDVSHWDYFARNDILFLNYPHTVLSHALVHEAKKHGLKIWLEWDDAIFHVPVENKYSDVWNNPDVKKRCIDILKIADVITVCSELQKKEFIEDYGIPVSRISLIPNAIDDRLLAYAKPFKKNNRIAWRGSDSHFGDLVYYGEAIIELINKYPKHEFNFFGIYPGFLLKNLRQSNVRYAKTVNYIDFIRGFTEYNASLLYVPLTNSFFNRVKSPLAWLDGSLAGSVVLAPDCEQWRGLPGLFLYKSENPQNFKSALLNLIDSSELDLECAHRDSMIYICENLLLSKVNELRLKIIEGL